MALSGSDGARDLTYLTGAAGLTGTAGSAGNTPMYFALMAIGAMLGLVLNSGHGTQTLLAALLGGFAGYALAELGSLRARGSQLEKEIDGLKERLAAMQRQQRAGESAAEERAAAAGAAPGVAAPPSHGAASSASAVPPIDRKAHV